MKSKGKRIAWLALVSMLMAAGCGEKQESVSLKLAEGESDFAYIQSKGTLVAGITDFAPMDYRDGEEWAGFDAELAEDFAERMGVTLELKEIEWNDKIKLFHGGI